MILDIESLYFEIGVSPGRGKQQSRGWVNIECPFCSGNPGVHLGYNTQKGYFNCWRCGKKTGPQVVARLANCTYKEAKKIIQRHTIGPHIDEDETASRPGELFLPPGSGAMGPRHKKYLKARGLDPDYIERLWGVQGTGLDQPYPWRIIAPIYWEGNLVSFQTRDITGRSHTPYRACPSDKEQIPHKHILYCPRSDLGASAVIVEGIFDAWKLGPGAVATFGISFTNEQVSAIARLFNRVFIFYDNPKSSPEAQEKALKLHTALRERHQIEAYIVEWEWEADDPADLRPEEAQLIMADLIGRNR